MCNHDTLPISLRVRTTDRSVEPADFRPTAKAITGGAGAVRASFSQDVYLRELILWELIRSPNSLLNTAFAVPVPTVPPFPRREVCVATVEYLPVRLSECGGAPRTTPWGAWEPWEPMFQIPERTSR